MCLRHDSATNRKASSKNWKASSKIQKVFSEESEGFFRRALGLYTHKFPKRGAASLTYLPHTRLGLPRLRLGLPRLRLSQNSGPATEGFSNRSINFKDAYRSCSADPQVLDFSGRASSFPALPFLCLLLFLCPALASSSGKTYYYNCREWKQLHFIWSVLAIIG